MNPCCLRTRCRVCFGDPKELNSYVCSCHDSAVQAIQARAEAEIAALKEASHEPEM